MGVVVRAERDATVVAAFPRLNPAGRWTADAFALWQWPIWVEPTWHSRLKPVYDSLKTVWERTR